MERDSIAAGPDDAAQPDARTRAVGQLICAVAIRAPWAWRFLRRPVARFFSERADGWDERVGPGRPEHLQALAAAALQVRASPEAVLDLGCGTGDGTLFLAREFPQARIRGVDLSAEMVKLAQKKVGLDPEGRVAFRQADASRLPFEPDSFDLVTQVNAPVFAAEIARVLRPGGYVLIAASSGPRTPFYTPEKLLRAAFARRGIKEVVSGQAGAGTYYLGRHG